MKMLIIGMEKYMLMELDNTDLKLFYEMSKEYEPLMLLGGSCSSPYVKNKHDIDVIMLFSNREVTRNWHREYVNNQTLIGLRMKLHNDYGINIISYSVDIENEMHEFSYEKKAIIFGNKSGLIEHNIIEEAEQYKNACREKASKMLGWYSEKNDLYALKHMYHIYTGMCIIKNSSYELSEEEIENINILHDCENENSILTLVEEIRNWLESSNE